MLTCMPCCGVLPVYRFLGIQLVIVLNQNLALQQQQHQAASNGQAAAGAAAQSRSSGSGNATPLKKQSSGPLSPRRVSVCAASAGGVVGRQPWITPKQPLLTADDHLKL